MTIVLDQNGNPVEAGNVAGELISLRSENAKLKAELEQWQRSVCDQGEVIENLKAELAAETKKFEAAITTNERLLSDVRCANYELAAAQTDAERYRWLRELPNADSLNVRFIGCDLDSVIDEAIDAAMEAK